MAHARVACMSHLVSISKKPPARNACRRLSYYSNIFVLRFLSDSCLCGCKAGNRYTER